MSAELLDADETARVEALHALNVLDTGREERFDRIVRLVRTVVGVPMAAVNLVDTHRQWTKAEAGLDGLQNTAPEDSMCRYTVQQPSALIVPDLTMDERFCTNRFVTGDMGLRFYAGQPLRAPGGERVGSLRLFDTRPRTLSTREQKILADVMGKRIPATLIAATVRAMLVGAAQYNDQHQSLHRAAAASWDLLRDTGAFVTAFSARLHPATGRVDHVDAGHGLAFVLGEHGYRRLERSGPLLGALPDTTWQTHTTTLVPGETLVVVSDGYLDFFPTLEDTLTRAQQAQLHRLATDRLGPVLRIAGEPGRPV